MVVDASAIVTLLTDPSPVAEELASRLRDRDVMAPDHLPVETTNALRRRRNAGLLTESEARLALDGLWALPIQLWPFEVLAGRAWELRDNVSSYDAAYIALAERLGAPLMTGDERLSRAPGTRCAIEVFRSAT